MWDERGERALLDVLRSGQWADGLYPAGRDPADYPCEKFAREFAEYHDARYGFCVNSGTKALFAALKAKGVLSSPTMRESSRGLISVINASRFHGTDKRRVPTQGESFRMTQFQAALLRVQLSRLGEQRVRIKSNVDYLADRLDGICGRMNG